MKNLIFSYVILLSSITFAAPEKLLLDGESKLNKSNYIVTMELSKIKETPKLVQYKGFMNVINAGQTKRVKVEMGFQSKKSVVKGFALLDGTIFDGQGLEMRGTADLSNLKLGDSIDLVTKYMDYYMFPPEIIHPPNGEQYRRTLLDKGVTTLVVKE